MSTVRLHDGGHYAPRVGVSRSVLCQRSTHDAKRLEQNHRRNNNHFNGTTDGQHQLTKGTTTGTNQLRNRNHQRNRQLDDRKHRQTTPAQPKLIPIFTQIFSTKGAKTNNQINNQPKYNNKNLLFTISHNVQRWSWAHNQV